MKAILETEMPQNCYECPFSGIKEIIGTITVYGCAVHPQKVEIDIDGKHNFQRHEDCPLKPVEEKEVDSVLSKERIAELKMYFTRCVQSRSLSTVVHLAECGLELIEMVEALQQENERLKKTVDRYATAARLIAVNLNQFCDRTIPYDEMIVGAVRKASKQLAAYEDSQMIPEEVLKQKDENYLLRGVLKGINQCIGHAMIELEQGGKYDWNSDLEACNNWLKEAKEIIIETVKAQERGV